MEKNKFDEISNEVIKGFQTFEEIKNTVKNKPIMTQNLFKKISMENFKRGNFKKLGHAREAFAKELGFDCYRAYTNAYNTFLNKLTENVSKIIEQHKNSKNPIPIPILIVIDTDFDYVETIKEKYKDDFKYFGQYPKELLFTQGRKLSEINVYDIVSKIEFESNCKIVRENSNVIYINENCENITLAKLLEEIELQLPERIYQTFMTLKSNIIISRKKDYYEDYFLIIVFPKIIKGCLSLLEIFEEEELLKILGDKENGLPTMEYIHSHDIYSIYKRLNSVHTIILEEKEKRI
ncbi:hypothetical protein ACNSOL_11795 (plasmid) [Aliarcobacter lanthieri]|uniref:hypothetical protein n=1 Tax=Aliarcobacter lanthieri TaxID=1355374 RepID=UPI003AABC3E4